MAKKKEVAQVIHGHTILNLYLSIFLAWPVLLYYQKQPANLHFRSPVESPNFKVLEEACGAVFFWASKDCPLFCQPWSHGQRWCCHENPRKSPKKTSTEGESWATLDDQKNHIMTLQLGKMFQSPSVPESISHHLSGRRSPKLHLGISKSCWNERASNPMSWDFRAGSTIIPPFDAPKSPWILMNSHVSGWIPSKI